MSEERMVADGPERMGHDVIPRSAVRGLREGVTVLLVGAALAGCSLFTGTDNEPPTVTIDAPAAGASFLEGEEVTFRGSGTDPEGGELSGDALVWSSDRDGRLGTGQTLRLSDLSVGSHEITLTGEDAEGASGTSTVTVTVEPNQPPSAAIESPEDGAVVVEGQEVVFRGSGTDAEDGDLTGEVLRWSSSRDGDLGTGETVTRSDLSQGTHEITLTATDAQGKTGTASITLGVEENRAPSANIEAPGDGATFGDGESVTLRGTGSDPEEGALSGDALSWSSDRDGELGTGETVSRSDLSVGTHVITLTATDSQGATGTATVTISVEDNQAPSVVIERPDDGASFSQGESVTFEGSADDPEDGALTGGDLQWSSDRDGDLGTGETVTRSDLSQGTHEITLTATDSQGATGTATISVTVVDNDPPTANIREPSAGHISSEGETVTFEGTGSDPEDGSLTGSSLTWRSDRDGRIGSGETVDVSDLSAGPHRVTLIAEDSNGLTDTDHVEILVESPGYDIRVRFLASVSSSQESIIRDAIAEWEQTITGDLSPAFPGAGGACAESGRGVDDLLVSIDVVDIDGSGGVLARAGPCLLRSSNGLPIAGVMEIDGADIDAREQGGNLDELVLHEVGHVLGIGISAVGDWGTHLRDIPTLDPYFAGPEARDAFGDIGGEAYLSDPVPLANTGGEGTRSAHWREVNFENELMTGFLNSGSNPMSSVTVGSLADIGYSVDMSQADAFGMPMPQLALWEATADATLARPQASDENFGSSGDETLGENIVAGANGGNWGSGHPSDELYTGLLRFGVPPLPSGVSIESAELELYKNTDRSSGSGSVELLQATGGWSEGGVTWDSRPGFGSTLVSYGSGCGDSGACLLSSSALRSLVRDWADGSTSNHGLVLDAPNASGDNPYSVGYTARHSSDEGSRPRMRVEASTGGAARTAGARTAGGVGADGRIPLGQDVLLDIPLYVQTPDGRVLRIR